MTLQGPDGAAFREFADEVRAQLGTISSGVDTGGHGAVDLLEVSIAESAQTLRLLQQSPPQRADRLLEIGSGLGLTSIYLERSGHDITSVEPAATGFSFHGRVAAILFDVLGASHPHIAATADSIPSSAGPFDLVFSNNVVEHIGDPFAALDHLMSLLADGGRMLHSCPNYSFPYEPHFGVPLLPVRPALTARFLPERISASEVWASLNFVTAGQVKRWADDSGFRVDFRRGQLADSIERLTRDQEFADRHRSIGRLAGVLQATGVTRVVRHLPAKASTPMEFIVTSDGSRRTATGSTNSQRPLRHSM